MRIERSSMVDSYYLPKQTKERNSAGKRKKLECFQCSTFENVNVFSCKIFLGSSGFADISLTLPMILFTFRFLVKKNADGTCQIIYEHLMEPKYCSGV